MMQIDWAQLFNFSMAPLEIFARGTLMFWFLFLIFRFVLRRDVGSIGIGDFLFVAIVADASQNAMSADAKTVADGFLLVGTLVVWNYLIDYLSYRIPAIRRFTEARSLLLVRNGKLNWRNMRREFITREELMAKLRQEGLEELTAVKEMRLESDGEISIIHHEKG